MAGCDAMSTFSAVGFVRSAMQVECGLDRVNFLRISNNVHHEVFLIENCYWSHGKYPEKTPLLKRLKALPLVKTLNHCKIEIDRV